MTNTNDATVLGGVPVVPITTHARNLMLLLWGPSGVGKTIYACTAPGIKLYLQFDPDGSASVAYRDDMLVMDFAAQSYDVLTRFQNANNPLGLETYLQQHPEVQTIILDSVTTLAEKAVDHAIQSVKSAEWTNPGLKGYGHRNAIVLRVLASLLQMAARQHRHLIIIAHQDVPVRDDKGVVLYITNTMSEKMGNITGAKVSEVWHMSDTGKERRILVRPARMLQPMKTRMFRIDKTPEFVVRYNANTGEGTGLAEVYQAWQDAGYKPIPLPT